MSKDQTELHADLTLIEFKKSKGTDQRSGFVLTFTTPVPNSTVPKDDEREIKKTLHGILTLQRNSMFADADKEADGKHKMTFSGKLKRTNIASKKESPAYSKWAFTLANRPQDKDLHVLLDMACADGDDVEAVAAGHFKIQKITDDEEPEGRQLFSDDEPEGLSEEDAAILAGEGED